MMNRSVLTYHRWHKRNAAYLTVLTVAYALPCAVGTIESRPFFEARRQSLNPV